MHNTESNLETDQNKYCLTWLKRERDEMDSLGEKTNHFRPTFCED